MLKLKQEHLHFRFLVLLKPKGRLLNNPAPLLLGRGQHSEHRFQSLTVKFALAELDLEKTTYLIVEVPECEG